ncbi:hypothetical protein PFISCL1PPCAC_7096, partial [Pristionchus fissidentatus]
SLSPSEMALSLVVNSLSKQSARVMDTIQQLGDAIPHGTQLGDSMLQLMDVVIELDTTIADTQHAVAYMHSNPARSRRGRRSMEEAAELLQLRAEKTRWTEERQQMQQKLQHVEQRLKCVQELNSMLMERGAAVTPTSSGFCSSASHSPRSDDDGGEEKGAPPMQQPQQVVARKETLSPVVEESAAVQSLDYTPEFSSATFKDSIRLNPRTRLTQAVAAASDADKTIEETDEGEFLSESPDARNEGPLCSTFKDAAERSVYHTPLTHRKNRRRSSSLGDMVKKMFTPHRKIKNPVLDILE